MSYLLRLSGTSSDLWDQEVNTEWCILVLEEALELGDLLAEHVWGVSHAANDTDAAGVRHGCGELRSSSHVHASQHDGVVDVEEVGRGRADLLYRA